MKTGGNFNGFIYRILCFKTTMITGWYCISENTILPAKPNAVLKLFIDESGT